MLYSVFRGVMGFALGTCFTLATGLLISSWWSIDGIEAASYIAGPMIGLGCGYIAAFHFGK